LDYLRSLFTSPDAAVDRQAALTFLQRLMQFTGPLTAKGVEDTTFYVYNALISHDEVGDAPSSLGISINEFHKKMQARQSTTPSSLNATATHDTKRGEDSRLRLNALCDFPKQWLDLVTSWMKTNQRFHTRTSKGVIAPQVNDEYFIYQAIVGGFPPDYEASQDFLERVEAYIVKVLREAKVNSDWAAPDEEYENACCYFIQQILLPESEFVKTLVPFLKEVVALSNRYALAQSLIKITAPGIPDTYQGAGLWDLSFVDPDNRRPVDYNKRIEFLQQIHEKENQSNSVLFSYLEDHRFEGIEENQSNSVLFSYLEDHRFEGIEKLFVTEKALMFRKENPALFAEGEYLPLQLTGKDMVTVSYARNKGNKWALLVIPLRPKSGVPVDDPQSVDEVILPDGAPTLWKNVFTGDVYNADARLNVNECCKNFPVALLTNI
jgi:(1->4)-alpha-D-glucan 1-alpha-D-glucosylmutase